MLKVTHLLQHVGNDVALEDKYEEFTQPAKAPGARAKLARLQGEKHARQARGTLRAKPRRRAWEKRSASRASLKHQSYCSEVRRYPDYGPVAHAFSE